MPQPHPGQEWKHGWIPLTADAAREKNHGRKPGGGSLISRMVAEAAETHKRMQARDAERGKQGTRTAPDKTTAGKTAKPKQGRKVGADSRNAPLREGDQVAITEGRHRGKTGTVTGKGKHGAIQVDVDGEKADMSPANLRSKSGAETSRQADAAIRRAAGREPGRKPTPIGRIQDDIRDAYDNLAARPGSWVSLNRLRKKLSQKLPRERVDEALRLLERRPDVAMVPESNQKTLTPAEREAAINIGDQDKHLILFTK